MKRRSASDPFDSERRRAIGQACRNRALTRAELARHLGVEPPGKLETVVKAMLREGVLDETSVRHARGTAFRLRAKWRRALDTAVEAAHPAGLLRRGLRVLVVTATNPPGLELGVAAAAQEPGLVWATRADGPVRLILALESREPADTDRIDRLQGVFARGGAECLQFVVDDVMSLPRFAQHAVAVSSALRPELTT
jgi:hypothetical protein